MTGKLTCNPVRPVSRRRCSGVQGVSHVYFSIGFKAAPYAAAERYLIHLFTVVWAVG